MGNDHTDRGQEILTFLVANVPHHPQDLVRVACEKFGITRQAVNRYLQELIDGGKVLASGNTNQRRYGLPVLWSELFALPIANLEEDTVWREKIAPLLIHLPKNVVDVWQYCASEMINNAIDHSGGGEIQVSVQQNAAVTEIVVVDNGIGIFRKVRQACNLEDERHAVLELAKGKLTTDPEHHTGEGIFFTSRMLDSFEILSGDVFFSHKHEDEKDWISEREKPDTGTAVFMVLANASKQTTQQVFDYFASEEHDYGFTKTVVPVRMARHDAEQLVSRSQAKRLLARMDRFAIVLFDFQGVDTIGPAFADEIFRVFERSHPSIRLVPINTSPLVEQMIARAQAAPRDHATGPEEKAQPEG